MSSLTLRRRWRELPRGRESAGLRACPTTHGPSHGEGTGHRGGLCRARAAPGSAHRRVRARRPGRRLAATQSLVDGDAQLAGLGEHRLKDFPEPVALFQLGQEHFPPLKTISNTNLPRPVSSFVGRAKERTELVDLLSNGKRLVTLTGSGGSGKTRLAVETATELIPVFPAGVFWVELAPLRDPTLVTETIAQVLGAKDGLVEHVGEREMLLLLDNFEQLVYAATEIGPLLEGCPKLRLLVTSRERRTLGGPVPGRVNQRVRGGALSRLAARRPGRPRNEIHSDDRGRILRVARR